MCENPYQYGVMLALGVFVHLPLVQGCKKVSKFVNMIK